MTEAIDDDRVGQMLTSLGRWGRLSDAVRPALKAASVAREYRKGQHLARPGSALPFVMFVCSGLLRFYTVTADGRQSNRAFAAENRWIGPFTEESADWPAPYGLEALEDSSIMRFLSPIFADCAAAIPISTTLCGATSVPF